LEEARHAAQETIRIAREKLDAEATDARNALDTKADALAAEILRVIIPSAAVQGNASGSAFSGSASSGSAY
jgi:hypothetical protein